MRQQPYQQQGGFPPQQFPLEPHQQQFQIFTSLQQQPKPPPPLPPQPVSIQQFGQQTNAYPVPAAPSFRPPQHLTYRPPQLSPRLSQNFGQPKPPRAQHQERVQPSRQQPNFSQPRPPPFHNQWSIQPCQTTAWAPQPGSQMQKISGQHQRQPCHRSTPQAQGGQLYVPQNNIKQYQREKKNRKILSQGHQISGPVVVRQPANEEERIELEEWINQRKKNWPTDANIQQKNFTEKTNSQQQLTQVLKKQKEMGLVRKAGTEELVEELLEDNDGGRNCRTGGHRFSRGRGRGKGRVNGRGRGRSYRKHGRYHQDRYNNQEKTETNGKTSLGSQLVEKDYSQDRMYLIQAFRFLAKNKFLLNLETEQLVYPSRDGEWDQEQTGKQMLIDGDEDSACEFASFQDQESQDEKVIDNDEEDNV